MKCKYCGIELTECYVGNSNCHVKEHHMCPKHIDRIGMGLYDPCFKLKVDEWYSEHMKYEDKQT